MIFIFIQIPCTQSTSCIYSSESGQVSQFNCEFFDPWLQMLYTILSKNPKKIFTLPKGLLEHAISRFQGGKSFSQRFWSNLLLSIMKFIEKPFSDISPWGYVLETGQQKEPKGQQ